MENFRKLKIPKMPAIYDYDYDVIPKMSVSCFKVLSKYSKLPSILCFWNVMSYTLTAKILKWLSSVTGCFAWNEFRDRMRFITSSCRNLGWGLIRIEPRLSYLRQKSCGAGPACFNNYLVFFVKLMHKEHFKS